MYPSPLHVVLGMTTDHWFTLIIGLLAFMGVLATVVGTQCALRRQLRHSTFVTRSQLRSAQHLLREQQRHDAFQRDRERHMQLRREVFLGTVEAMTRLSGQLSHAGNPDYDGIRLVAEMTADIATISKIQVVGSDATIAATTAFSTKCGTCFLQMMMKRNGVQIVNTLIAAEKDPAKQIELHKRKIHLLQENTRELTVLSSPLGNLLTDAIAAIRSELDLSFDREAYISMSKAQTADLQQSWQQSSKQVTDFVKALTSTVSPPSAKQ